MIVGITIGAVAEALLCAAGGADMAKVREAISGGFADSRILQLHGQRMVERDFAPRGAWRAAQGHAQCAGTAEEIGFDAPITPCSKQLYAEGVEHGLGELDHSGLFVELASRNACNKFLHDLQTARSQKTGVHKRRVSAAMQTRF
jgi:3-hydroxyisobutyrate dehydrogenase-like beta-hydroxyacid dehydrogenase